MKRFVIILLALCLILGCVLGLAAARKGAGGSGEPVALYDPENVATPGDADAPETEPKPLRRIDYDALSALHGADEVVGEVNGRDVTWGEYFFWLKSMCVQQQGYLQSLADYGQYYDWDDKASSENEMTIADITVEQAKEYLRQISSIESVAEEKGFTLTEEDEARIDDMLKEEMAAAGIESEEEFNAYLAENHYTRELYDRINRANRLINKGLEELFGENGEKVSEEEAIAYLEDHEYLCASHILFMTSDLLTGEEPDEEAIAAKRAQAEAVSAELRAIEDHDELVRRFGELKREYCDDEYGVQFFPDGYLYTPGDMLDEVEDAVDELEEYEVSAPILSQIGYHVILRLPLSADMTMDYSEDGTPKTARAVCGEALYGALMRERLAQTELTLRDDVAALDLTQFLVAAE